MEAPLSRPPSLSPFASVSLQSLIAWLENSPRGKRAEIENERERERERGRNMDRGYKWCNGGTAAVLVLGAEGTWENIARIPKGVTR